MTDKPILILDFDGVLHSYTSPWAGATVIPDPPVPGAIPFILSAGEVFRVAIFSSHSSQDGGIQAMIDWLLDNGLPLEAVEPEDAALYHGAYSLNLVPEPWEHSVYFPTEKPPARVALDDRAVTFNGMWPDPADLLRFKPWNKR
jgi:hypothetical protein